MKKYLVVIRNSFSNQFSYRADFWLARVASVIRLLTLFLLWRVFLGFKGEIFGYEQKTILTYILGVALLRNFVFSLKSNEVAPDIASGNLNQSLLKPIDFLGFWFSRDLADKIVSLFFAFWEVLFVVLVFEVNIFWQGSLIYLLLFGISVFLAIILYFILSFLISLTTFWYFEHSGWPARFLFEVIIDFVSGAIFPLDIVPGSLRSIFLFLPSAFLIHYPMQIYLGRIPVSKCFWILLIAFFWIVIVYLVSKFLWKKGLIRYEAFSG